MFRSSFCSGDHVLVLPHYFSPFSSAIFCCYLSNREMCEVFDGFYFILVKTVHLKLLSSSEFA